jgi:ABC-2 type transport system ATP-binding protein
MIEVENLDKWFGPFQAVKNVSFSVKKGEVLGFLGPNGAGKSTTMRMITGFIPSDGGKITIGGHDIEDETIAAKRMIGYLPENAPLYGDMTVEGFLKFVAELRGMRGAAKQEAVDQIIETCYLQPVRRQPIDTLSKGYRHRTCFAQSIIHDPEVLILDEPTDGLDPNQKHEMRNLIKRMGERKAIIISTHILEEVDAVCSRVIIINDGQLVANGLPSELRAQSNLAGSVLVTISGKKWSDVESTLRGIDGVSKASCVDDANGACIARVTPKKSTGDALAASVAAAVSKAGWQLSGLETDGGRLDEVFRQITSGDAPQSKPAAAAEEVV